MVESSRRAPPMHLIDPEILAEARGLTAAMSGTICVLGLALWLFGWRWHRFWVVSGITLTAGVIGLHGGGPSGQVLAVGILLAVAAGMLALELARVLAFVAGGVGAWFAVQWVLPQAQELWAVFLSGGLLGLLLYRLWTMVLTSLAGVLLSGHAGVLLIEPVLKFDAVAWVAGHPAAVNGVVVAMVVLGILLQAAASPEEDEAKPKADEKDEADDEDDHHAKKGKKHHHDDEDDDDKPAGGSRWWRRIPLPTFRKAA